MLIRSGAYRAGWIQCGRVDCRIELSERLREQRAAEDPILDDILRQRSAPQWAEAPALWTGAAVAAALHATQRYAVAESACQHHRHHCVGTVKGSPAACQPAAALSRCWFTEQVE